MRRARSLYRLNVAIGVLALVAMLLGLAISVGGTVDFSGFSLAAVAAACGHVLFPHVTVGDALVLVLGGVSLAVFGFGVRSLIRQLWSRRQLRRRLSVIGLAGHRPHAPLLIDDPRPQAFCAGYLRPRIYVSTGTLELLDDEELGAVLAHERHHARRRDPLRVLVLGILSDALFFLPIMRRLGRRYGALAELAADEAAVLSVGQSAPLASAMLAFGQVNQRGAVAIGPERVDHLLGEQPRWELPLSTVVGAAVSIAGLFVLAAGASQAADAGHVSLPMLIAQACMVAMTVVPIFLGVTVLVVTRRILLGPLR